MLRINDKWDVPWNPGMTVADVLVAMHFTHPVLVVSVNGILVPPDAYAGHTLADGDEVKAIHVIAGG